MTRFENIGEGADDGKITRRKLSDQVFERLRAMIEAGEVDLAKPCRQSAS